MKANIYGLLGWNNKLLATDKYILSIDEKGMLFIIGKKDFNIYHKLKIFKN